MAKASDGVCDEWWWLQSGRYADYDKVHGHIFILESNPSKILHMLRNESEFVIS